MKSSNTLFLLLSMRQISMVFLSGLLYFLIENRRNLLGYCLHAARSCASKTLTLIANFRPIQCTMRPEIFLILIILKKKSYLLKEITCNKSKMYFEIFEIFENVENNSLNCIDMRVEFHKFIIPLCTICISRFHLHVLQLITLLEK